jgi:hypothetical protein
MEKRGARRLGMPQRVGEFEVILTGQIVSVAYEGDGLVSMHPVSDEEAPPVIVRVEDFNDWFLGKGVLRSTEPMRRDQPNPY